MMNFKKGDVFIELEDYSVSGEKFSLRHIDEYDILITDPIPSSNKLGEYYMSSNYISHSDKKRTLFEKLYHTVKKITIANKIKMIEKGSPKKGILLDIGCGTGEFLLAAQQNQWSVLGIEPNEVATTLAQSKGINILDSTENLESESVDVITMWHVLEHVVDLEEQLLELKRLLKPDGILVVAVPNFKSYDAQYYKKFWAAYDVPRHIWHFSQNGISKIFSEQGFELQRTLPMFFDSFYVSLLSEQYKNGKEKWLKAFFIGLKSNFKAMYNSEYSSLVYLIKK